MTTAMVLDQDGDDGVTHGGQLAASQGYAVQLAAATLDKRIATARAFPRSVTRFKQRAAQLLTEDVETARSAEYAKPVGSGTVRGASIRLAELAAMCWRNLDVEVSEPIIGESSVTVIATAWDIENNYRQQKLASASILTRDGKRYAQHMVDTAAQATASKAVRNAILAVIPRAYINDLLAIAKDVATKNKEPFEVVRKKTLDYFAVKKVSPEQLYQYLEIAGADDITEEHLDELRAIAAAIKDGEAKPEDYFGDAKSKAEAANEKRAARQAKRPSSVLDGPGAASPEAAQAAAQ